MMATDHRAPTQAPVTSQGAAVAAADGPLLFAMEASRTFGERLAARMGIELARHEERDFEAGEHKSRPLDPVEGRGIFVVQGLQGDAIRSANDKLIRLLFFVAALRDAGARHVTAITPYLAYARKDRRTKPRDPVNSRYVAMLFESMGADQIVPVEVHNVAAFENAFRTCRPEHVSTAALLADHFAPLIADQPVAVVSPDAGGNKRAELFRHQLELRIGRAVGKGIMDKHRSMGEVTGSVFAGDVAGCLAIIIDDLISSGTTLVHAAEACRRAGAARVVAAATHGLFTSGAPALFGPDGPDEIVVTDTVPVPGELAALHDSRLQVVSVAGLLADVILRLHRHEPVVDLLPYD